MERLHAQPNTNLTLSPLTPLWKGGKKSRLGGEKRNPTPITKARKDGDDQVLRFGFIQSLLYPP